MREAGFGAEPGGARAVFDQPNLIVYRASRLEALLDPLVHLLDSCAPADVLTPQLVLAAHPCMKQWLSGALARKRGPSGIVANVDIQLPSAWLDACTQEYLGGSAVALHDYRSERLRWRIHGLLPQLLDAEISACLQGQNASLRRYQLSDRLAKLFIQYMVYRPDWLVAWQDGQPAARNAGFQPELWRRLRGQMALPHRGEWLEQLIDRLRQASFSIPQDPLHVFGISHLAPAELRLLTAMAGQRPVFLYVPDPSARYWGDASMARSGHARLMGLPASAQRREDLMSGDAFEAASESLFLDEVGHPLLASWGRMGQHFMLALEASRIAMDVRHWQDEVPPSVEVAQTLLARVQASIRDLDSGLPARAVAVPGHEDASLRIHSCHTRLRELEVLRDALLAARSEIPDLKPAEIAVMAPNMATYVPLLGSVFGPAGSTKVDLPYHLADVSVARTHSIFTAFTQLLALPQSRISAPEVVDLLRVPQVAAALGIDSGGVDTLAQWLQRAGITWGLDGEFRAQFDVPPGPEFTFAWGVERVLAGYAFGQELPGRALNVPGATGAEAVRLWPVEGIEGPQAALVGVLDSLLQGLASLHRDAATRRPASAWSERLLGLVDQFFRIDRRDRDAREALATLRSLIEALGPETSAAGDPELPFEVVREVLVERLAAVSGRQHLLMGGITFCGMVAARALPFRVIAVLGLNDGEFPRQANGAGLDLTLQPGNRRIGDRDVRNDDRYLFLETLMAARERLHLSYVGVGVQDGRQRNPAGPLTELMTYLDRGTVAEGRPLDEDERRVDDAADTGTPGSPPLRPWRVAHRLQPFDARYFQGNGRLFSFDQELARAKIGSDKPPSFVSSRTPIEIQGDAEVPLRSVIAWFKDPAKQLLTSALQLRLDALEQDGLQADECLEPTLSAAERIPRQLVLDVLLALPTSRQIPVDPPDWLKLSGKLPVGRLGELVWAGEKGLHASAVKLLGNLPDDLAALPLSRTPATVSWRLNGAAVSGEVHDVLTCADKDVLWIFDAHEKMVEKLDFKQRIPLFLQWALLRLQTPDEVGVRICLLFEDTANPDKRDWRDAFSDWCGRFANDPAARPRLRADLDQRVGHLLDVYLAAQRDTVWYFPKTSWASRANDLVGTVQAWTGDGAYFKGEASYAPGYAALFARGRGLDDVSSLELLADLQKTARWLDRLIDLDRLLEPLETVAGIPELEA
jgi:exodeoxyribonuclease V gamma subunit